MKKIGIHELYETNLQEADEKLWGRKPNPDSRRGFLKKAGLASMALAIGADVVFAKHMPSGLIPAWFANDPVPFQLDGKDPEMTVLNDRPWNIEAPPHLLNDAITPAEKLFVRNNGLIPEVDVDTWTLTIEGESVRKNKVYTLAELKTKFPRIRQQLTIECGGNGRAEFNPPAKGNQWTTGAVGCPEWEGIRLKDVLEDVGIAESAVYIGYYGKDVHLSKDPAKVVISRGVPISKAMEEESMLAFAMNGQELPLANGFPLRLVFGGWPASTSGKWVDRIVVRDKVHDGPKMGGQSYRVPCKPVAPGADVPESEMCIIESMPVKSLITSPKSGAMLGKRNLAVGGHAWAGDLEVSKVEYSIDFGMNWHPCTLSKPVNRLAWQRWDTEIIFPQKGYYEVWARATDSNGSAQPLVVPGWNPKGYLNNACHRIAVKVLS